MDGEIPGGLIDETATASIWAFPEVLAAKAVGRGQRWLDERVLVGWATPSEQLARHAQPGVVDRRRLDSMPAARRVGFLSGRGLLQQLLAELFPGALVGSVDTETEGYGRSGPVAVYGLPALASLAHTVDLVVVAVAATSRVVRLGVDVEVEEPQRRAALAAGLSLPPRSATEAWVSAQAVLKARRLGLRADPKMVTIEAGSARIRGYPTRYRLERLQLPGGVRLAAAWQQGKR